MHFTDLSHGQQYMFAHSFIKFLSKRKPKQAWGVQSCSVSLRKTPNKKGICSVTHCLHFCDFMNERVFPQPFLSNCRVSVHSIVFPHASADLGPEEAPQLASTYMPHIYQTRFYTPANKQGVPWVVSGLLISF